MAEETVSKGPVESLMNIALKRFKIGKSGLKVVMQKGKAGPEFKFRPVHYDPFKDTIVLHHRLISDQAKLHKVSGDRLMGYLIHFGVGMGAEFRRMSTKGVCPLFNFVRPEVGRKWYKAHWTRLEEEAGHISQQVIEYAVDDYLYQVKLGNPIPVVELNGRLRGLRKEDVSRFQQEVERNLIQYIARSKFTADVMDKASKERDLLSRLARTAAGPKRWFYLERALKKIRFGHPESYVEGYPAVIEAMFPGLELRPQETSMDGLPEKEQVPKVWKSDSCTYFEWDMNKETK